MHDASERVAAGSKGSVVGLALLSKLCMMSRYPLPPPPSSPPSPTPCPMPIPAHPSSPALPNQCHAAKLS
ncbi:hypothetical protein HaLaN_06562 [Haematococcus lacustris]|uniref:Uncharacterized protein n=1 Tax=Haematococcus lacustris TaxID=44745 RepID=A0A699YX55_HAELA|nr:hypothetical protein HaLaN_06562 [Haematococcus lacustris]